MPKMQNKCADKMTKRKPAWNGVPEDYKEIKMAAKGIYKLLKGPTSAEIIIKAQKLKEEEDLKVMADRARAYINQVNQKRKRERIERFKIAWNRGVGYTFELKNKVIGDT